MMKLPQAKNLVSVQAGDLGIESSPNNDNDLSGCGSHVTYKTPDMV